MELWHNLKADSEWDGLPFELCRESIFDVATATVKPKSKKWFRTALRTIQNSERRPVSFTLRFRAKGETGWKWVHDLSGANDGQLVFQQSIEVSSPRLLTECFDGLSEDLEVEHVLSDVPHTQLWKITAKAAPAKGETSGYSNHILGYPKHLLRWFSLVRLWSPWLAPRQGKGLPFAEKDGVLYSFLRSDGLHVVALAISGIKDVLTVFRHENDEITIHTRNDREMEGVAYVLVALGNTFAEANAAVMYQARRIVSPYLQVSTEDKKAIDSIETKAKDANASWIQDWYDGFTYCTWNGLGQNLTEEKISAALASLEKEGIKSQYNRRKVEDNISL